MKWTVLAITSVLVPAALGAACAGPTSDESTNEAIAAAAALEAAHTASVDRTREQILMLDDLYKTAVVLMTEHYVQDTGTLSAATAAKALFQTMQENG